MSYFVNDNHGVILIAQIKSKITSELLDLLFQIPEQFRVKEFLNRDSQTIAELLDRGYGGAAVSSADDIVDRGLSHATHAAEFVDGNITLIAQFQDAFLDGLADVHGDHLVSTDDDTQFLLKRLTLLSQDNSKGLED